tara:strand:+ start:1734 stop:2084 length:351 start_codon:yes stop_codon:yes gene_type:complete
MPDLNRICPMVAAFCIAALLCVSGGCTSEPDPVFSPLDFAKKSLADSYAAKAELGEIEDVTVQKNEGLGHAFAVKGSKQNATMALLSITPGGEPSGTLFLDDGRQIPLFMPFLEDS